MTVSLHVLRQLLDTARIHPQKVAVILDDQAWTYSELIERIERVVCHLHRLNVVQGQIIYQFVERGFEMVCGLFGIMYAGGVYCPINPTEPADRLALLLEQIQGQYVLVQEKTRSRFPSAAIQHVVLLDNTLLSILSVVDIDDLPLCQEYGAAYIICTSGTTERQKMILHTHKSFSTSDYAYAQWDVGIYTVQDQVLQVATCSWILHLTEISLPLIVGGTLILLRPDGHLDMAYFAQTLLHQQVTTLLIGPGIIRALTNYLEISQRMETFSFVRNLCTAGNYEMLIYFENLFFDWFVSFR
jgi:non-ribosomal peptide synthetase component F